VSNAGFPVSTDSSCVVMQKQEQQGGGFAQADRQLPGAGPSGRGGPPQDQYVQDDLPSTSAAGGASEDVHPRDWEFDPEVSNDIASSMQHIHGDALLCDVVVVSYCVMQAGELLCREDLQRVHERADI